MNRITKSQAIKDTYPVLPSQSRILLTVRQFSDKHPAFTQGAIRNLIFWLKVEKHPKALSQAMV